MSYQGPLDRYSRPAWLASKVRRIQILFLMSARFGGECRFVVTDPSSPHHLVDRDQSRSNLQLPCSLPSSYIPFSRPEPSPYRSTHGKSHVATATDLKTRFYAIDSCRIVADAAAELTSGSPLASASSWSSVVSFAAAMSQAASHASSCRSFSSVLIISRPTSRVRQV